ncbi:MAG: flavin-dependent dehydrogenase [Sphingobacteriales bacterium]|jgi:flavin-dependent dehydrogenase
METVRTEVAIIGAGPTGLVASQLLAKEGVIVHVFEKSEMPKHKVCGEYISKEVFQFLKDLGNPLDESGFAEINKLSLSGPNGEVLNTDLDLGGFGLSRYKFDELLAKNAEKMGVVIHANTAIENVEKIGGKYVLTTKSNEKIYANWVIGAQGKRSELDKNLKRKFWKKRSHFMGVKYHVKGDFDENSIFLDIFKDGYCGFSKVEGDLFCLCYLVKADKLKSAGSIDAMEAEIGRENPRFAEKLLKAEKINEQPLVINQVSFLEKERSHDGVIMAGDAAGMISPLCGNGMAMGIQAAKLAVESYLKYPKDEAARNRKYEWDWNLRFKTRFLVGSILQNLFFNPRMINTAIKFLGSRPRITKKIISLTHGIPLK